jgi:hypothetical protein
LLPGQSPWLNSIEPFWIHAKRKVVQPDGELTAHELMRSVTALVDVDLASVDIQSSDWLSFDLVI